MYLNNHKYILFIQMSKTICVIVAYFEGNEDYKKNMKYFLQNGYYDDNNIDYYIVINGYDSLNLPQYRNLSIHYRKNEGYDFGAYGHIFQQIKKKYDYYFFINSTVRGPFLPAYAKMKWYQPFIDLMTNDVKLVGPTINVCTLFGSVQPHVQSYMFAMDDECLQFLQESQFFNKGYTDRMEIIKNLEVGLSTVILNHGWNISCLVPEYQNVDYRNLSENDNKKFALIDKNCNGDILYPGRVCFGRDLHPYELIFIKTNRGLAPQEIDSLTKQNYDHTLFDRNDWIEQLPSAWKGHRKFAEWLVEHIKPQTIVELGVDYGYSTFVFGQALKKNNTGNIYGLDLFEGDKHTSFRNTYDQVINNIQSHQLDQIHIIRGDFTGISQIWTKPIDILHIDGLHTYEAVKNDYNNWSPFVTNDGIILLHDICIYQSDFEVHKLFNEIDQNKLYFTHSAGLGLVSKNKQLLEDIKTQFPYCLTP